MPNILMAQQQQFLEVSPYINHRISMGTRDPISPPSYIYVILDAFTYYVVLNPSPKNDAANALTVCFCQWIVKFGIPDIFVTETKMNTITENLHTFAARIMSIFSHERLMHHGLMDL